MSKLLDKQLKVSKRAFAAARLVQSDVTLLEAASQCGVARDTVLCARLILEYGTAEEIAVAEAGRCGLKPLSTLMRGRRESQHKAQQTGRLWRELRTGLDAINSLPLPESLLTAARVYDKGQLDQNVSRAIDWLQKFERLRTRKETTNGKD